MDDLVDVLKPQLPGRVGPPEVPATEQYEDICAWKGQAIDHTLFVDADVSPDAAWFYPEPEEAATRIKSSVAFWT